MGVLAGQSADARHRHAARGIDDRNAPAGARGGAVLSRWLLASGLICASLAFATQSAADTVRVAYFHTELSQDGPGLFLRDAQKSDPPEQLAAVLRLLTKIDPDIVLLSGIDYDARLSGLATFKSALEKAGLTLPHHFSAPPNTGIPSGLDLDGDDRWDEPEDALAFGAFRGAGGLAILSSLPIQHDAVQDFTRMLWHDLPGADMPYPETAPERTVLPFSSNGHWDVPIALPNGSHLRLLTLHATPPVFDGPEDRNGRRNADQHRFWADYLNGWHPDGTHPRPTQTLVLGTFNADPLDGEARHSARRALLEHPRLQDPAPSALGGAVASASQAGVNANHRTPPDRDTVDWPDAEDGDPGNLRVDYILATRDLQIADSGLYWPGPNDPEGQALAEAASRHRLIWVDLAF